MSFLKKISLVLLLILSLSQISCSDTSDNIDNTPSPHVHNIVEYKEREPSCSLNGYIHHFKCNDCGMTFSGDDSHTVIYEPEMIYTEGHNVVDNQCTVCGLSSDSDLYFRGYKSSSGEFQYAVVSGVGKSEAEHIIIPSFVKSGSLKIPLERIDTGAFKDVSGVKSIFIPKTVKSIYQNAFKGCLDLEVVIFEDASACTTISGSIFSDCPKLEYVSFGNGSAIKNLASSAFKNCPRLTRVDFGENSAIESISEYCFDSCFSLSSIEIPSGVKKIGDKAFAKCAKFTSLEFTDNLTEIGDLAFEDCESLTELKIGNSVSKIGNYAFSGCKALENIFIPDTVRNIGSYAFIGCDKLTVTLGKGVSTTNFNPYWNIENRPVRKEE